MQNSDFWSLSGFRWVGNGFDLLGQDVRGSGTVDSVSVAALASFLLCLLGAVAPTAVDTLCEREGAGSVTTEIDNAYTSGSWLLGE